MPTDTFRSAGSIYKISVYPPMPTAGGKKYPIVILVHGNFGLGTNFRRVLLASARSAQLFGLIFHPFHVLLYTRNRLLRRGMDILHPRTPDVHRHQGSHPN